MDFKDLIPDQLQQADTTQQPKRSTPMAQAEESLLRGEYAFAPDKQVNVIGTDNKSYNIPGHQVKDAIEQGYRLEAPQETAKREFVKEYKGIKGDAIVGFGQFADEFLGGIPEAIYDVKSQRDDFDRKEALKEDHELANTLGGLSGFGASLVVPFGPLARVAGIGEKVAAKVATPLAASLAKRGISKEAAGLGAKILANTAEKTAQLGVEGLVQAAPMAATEAYLGNPEASAETLMMGGGLGIGLGLIAGPTGALFSKANKSLNDALKTTLGADGEAGAAKGFKRETIIPGSGDGSLLGAAEADGANDSIMNTLRTEVGKLKPHSDEIIAASETLGLKPLESQLSGSKIVQDYSSALSKKASLPGIKLAKQFEQRYDVYDKSIKSALNIGEDVESHFAVAEKAKVQMLTEAKNAINTEGAIFNELRQGYADVALDLKPMKQVANNIKKMTIISPEAKSLAKNISNEILSGNIKTLDDLKNLNTYINGSYGPTSAPEVKKLIGEISEKLANQEQNTIDRAITRKIEALKSPGAGTLDEAMKLQRLYDEMQVANKNWHELSKNLAESGDALGLGNIKRPGDFVRKVSDLSAEQLAKKLLPKNDVASLRILKEKFPAQFESIAGLEKAKLLDATLTDNKVSPQKFVTAYKKMTPEFREALFDVETRKILDAVKTDLEALPANINPSGTAKTASYMDLLKGLNLTELPKFILENGIDAAAVNTIKKSINVDNLINTEKAMGNVNKKLDQIPGILGFMSKAGKAVEKISGVESIMAAQKLLGDSDKDRRKSFEELKDKLEKAVVDPRLTVDHITEHTKGYADSAPNITNEFIKKNSQAISYLYNALPKPLNNSTPFFKREFKPSDMELAKFERKLSVVMDPMVVIDSLKEGTLTKDHMEALITNYPILHEAIKGRIFDHMTKSEVKLPYQARIKMSLMMGQDIDGTTAPQNVFAYQNSFAMIPEVNHNELNQSGLMKMKPAEQAMTAVQKGLKT